MPEYIERCAVISTAHVTRATMDAISANAPALPVCYPNEYGAFVYVTDDTAYAEAAGWPADWLAVYRFARGHGCGWVKLDRDAAEVEDLPVYDWDGAVEHMQREA